MTTYDNPLSYANPLFYDGTSLTPVPTPTNPVVTPNRIRYLFTDLTGASTLAELPLTGVTWSSPLNSPGRFGGTLATEDPRIVGLNWQNAVQPGKTCVWVEIDGTLVWGGIVNSSDYHNQGGTIQIGADDHYGYLARRLQAQDYGTTWATAGSSAGAVQIAKQIISDTLAVAGSLGVNVATPAATPAAYQVTLAVPLSQRMTVDSLVSQLSKMGWLVGFDYASDVAYAAGVPTATINLSYPRRGRIAGSTGLTVDLHTAVDWTYKVDGSQQANTIVEMSGGAGAAPASGSWEPSVNVDGYLLTEKAVSHVSFSPVASPASVLQAYINGDLSLYAYPVVTLDVTVPLFGDPPIGSYIVGDDVRVLSPVLAGQVPSSPRFPTGLDFYLRLTSVAVTIPEQGVPTARLTLTMPPSSTPQRPPL